MRTDRDDAAPPEQGSTSAESRTKTHSVPAGGDLRGDGSAPSDADSDAGGRAGGRRGTAASHLLRMLADGVAHEVRNPLAAILGYAELARRKVDCDREWIEGVCHEVRRIDEVVESLSELAHPSAVLTCEVDLNELVLRVSRELRASRRDLFSSVELIHAFDETMFEIETDPLRLEGVTEKLLLNAAEAVARGGGEGPKRIVLATETVRTGASPTVRLVVSDHGPGIVPEDAERVFEPFYTTKAPSEGMGLSLTVARHDVELLGGRIEVESAPGSGARFVVTLPVKAVGDCVAGRP